MGRCSWLQTAQWRASWLLRFPYVFPPWLARCAMTKVHRAELMTCFHTACSTQLTLAISFGGPAWPIRAADLNLGTVGNGLCLGAVFDISQGSDTPGGVNPSWIIGDTFLVGLSHMACLSPHPDGHCRKTYTVSSAPIRHLLASHSCQARLEVHPVSSVPFFSHIECGRRMVLCVLHRTVPTSPLPPSSHLRVTLLTHNLLI